LRSVCHTQQGNQDQAKYTASVCAGDVLRECFCAYSMCADYYFSTKEEIEAGVARGEFLESTVFAGNMYGTSKMAVQV
jgi:hypothetical protein